MTKKTIDLIDPPSAAELIGVTKGTLAKWRMRGEGPPFLSMGSGPRSRIKYRRADVHDWISSCLVER